MIYEEVELNELAVIEEALQKRPDYLALLVERDTSLLTRKVAANQRLPQLDFFADYGFSGLDDSHSDTNDVLRTLDYNNWQAGVQFSYPLFNRDARYTYRQAQKQVVLVEKTLENMQQFIAIQLRNIIRDINTSLKRIHVTADAVSYEEAKLRDQQKRFDVGMATSFEVLEFQEDLSETRVRNIQAIVSYNKSLIELSYDRGTLIEERNIEIETIDAAQ